MRVHRIIFKYPNVFDRQKIWTLSQVGHMYSLCIDSTVQPVLQLSRCDDSFGVGIRMSQTEMWSVKYRLSDLGLDI